MRVAGNMPYTRVIRLPAATPPGRSGERGAALIMSLVILVILTMLGVTAMNNSILEERMSGNTRDATRAFAAAESGVNSALLGSGNFDINASKNISYDYDNKKSGSADVTTTFNQLSPPKRDSGYSSVQYDVANFDVISIGSTTTGASSEIHQGIGQIIPKQ